MSETNYQTLSGVSETLLIPLYVRALESHRPDAMIKDEKAGGARVLATASACSTTGGTSTNPSRAWPTFDGRTTSRS